MPNWCSNELKITGPAKDIEDILKKANNEEENNEFSLEKLFPMPKDEDPDKWYDWRIANWGTKWDLSDVTIDKDSEESVQVNFSTAWAPPLEAFVKISEQYPNLNFNTFYAEPGADFCGIAEIDNGTISDNCVSYSERFGCDIEIQEDKAFIKDGVINCPIILVTVSDPYDFNSSSESIEWIATFPETMTDNDIESFYGDELDFKSETHDDFYDKYNDSEYNIQGEISSKLSAIIKAARYNNLDKEVPEKSIPTTSKKRKI